MKVKFIKYIGSKNRLSKHIVPIIQKIIDDNNIEIYIEPMVGGANLIDKIQCKKKIGNDIHKGLIELFKQLQNGWQPPLHISEEEYIHVRDNKENYPNYYVAFIGFCATFGSKYFGGYARGFKEDKITPRDIPNEAIRNLLEQVPNIMDIEFTCKDYKDFSDIKRAVIYCLPEGSLIYQDGIYKPIEDVVENKTDLWNGNICYKKHIRHTENEEIIKLNIMGISKHFDLRLSKNHIVFVYDKNKDIIYEKRAEELSETDLLIIDYNKNINNNIPKYSPYSDKSKKTVNIDYSDKNKLCELIGLFMAEGHLQNGLYFSFSTKEETLHKHTQKLIKDVFGMDASINIGSPHKSVTQVVCSSVELNQYFLEFYNGQNAKNKKLKDFVMDWDYDMQLYLLKGWLKGDGGLQENTQLNVPKTNRKRSGKRNKFKLTGTSASFELATQMYNIALRCGLHPCFKKRTTKRKIPLKNNSMITVAYDVYFTMKKDIEKIYNIKIEGRDCGRRFHTDNFLITKINSISKELYTGNMYDLTTKKGEFWSFGNVKIHNCDPPYANSTTYSGTSAFNYEEFWQWCREMSKENIVFISEYNAPDDFICIWSKEHKTSLKVHEHENRVERLFIHKGDI